MAAWCTVAQVTFSGRAVPVVLSWVLFGCQWQVHRLVMWVLSVLE